MKITIEVEAPDVEVPKLMVKRGEEQIAPEIGDEITALVLNYFKGQKHAVREDENEELKMKQQEEDNKFIDDNFLVTVGHDSKTKRTRS